MARPGRTPDAELLFSRLERMKAALAQGADPLEVYIYSLQGIIKFVNSDEDAKQRLLAQPLIALLDALHHTHEGGKPEVFNRKSRAGKPPDNQTNRHMVSLVIFTEQLINNGMSPKLAANFVAGRARQLRLTSKGVSVTAQNILRAKEGIVLGDAPPGRSVLFDDSFKRLPASLATMSLADLQDRISSALARMAESSYPTNPHFSG